MPEGLKLIVTSDVTQAEQNLKKFVATAGKEGAAAGTALSTGLNKVNPAAAKTFSNLSTQAKAAIKPISLLGDSIETLRAKLLAKKEFLITATDIGRVRELNIEIKALEAEITRLQSIGTGGVGESLGGVGTGVKKGFGVLRTAANILPGIGIAGLIGGLSDLVVGLFDAGEAFSKTELSAAKFGVEIKNATEIIDRFVNRLDFGAEIDKLKAKLNLGEGFRFDIASIDIDKQANDNIIKGTNGIIAELDRQASRLRSNLFAFGSKAGKELLDNFSAIDLPDNLLKNLPRFDRETLERLKANAELVVDAEKKADKAIDENEKLSLQKQIRQSEEQKKIQKDKLEAFEKFINDTISKAERLSSFIDKRGILDIGAGFKVDQTASKLENFKDAQSFINKALKSQFPFIEVTLPPVKFIDPNASTFEIDKKTIDGVILKHLKDAVSKTPLILPIPIDVKLIIRSEQLQAALANVNNIVSAAIIDSIASISQAVGSVLAGGDIKDGLNNFVGIIGDALQAIGKQLIIISGVAQAVKLALGDLFTNPALAFAAGVALEIVGAALKQTLAKGVTGFSEGGFTGHGNPNDIAGVVHKGEFVIPADVLNGLKGKSVGQPNLSGILGGNNMRVEVVGRINANDILLSGARQGKSNKRLAAA